MDHDHGGEVRRRARWVRVFGSALVRYTYGRVRSDFVLMATHARLFVGVVCITVGLLSFASDRYCDGNTSVYYACTRSAVYYFYPWWAVLLTLVGVISVLLWYMRRRAHDA